MIKLEVMTTAKNVTAMTSDEIREAHLINKGKLLKAKLDFHKEENRLLRISLALVKGVEYTEADDNN